MIGIAETGSGKTLAFAIPALVHIQSRIKVQYLPSNTTREGCKLFHISSKPSYAQFEKLFLLPIFCPPLFSSLSLFFSFSILLPDSSLSSLFYLVITFLSYLSKSFPNGPEIIRPPGGGGVWNGFVGKVTLCNPEYLEYIKVHNNLYTFFQ